MSNGGTDAWTPEHDAELRKLVGEGLSGGQVAKAMAMLRPGITRCAVIGRIRRTGLQLVGATRSTVARSGPIKARPKPRAAPSAKPVTKRIDPPWLPKVRSSTPLEAMRERAFEPLPGIAPLPLTQRKPSQCAWPVGEPERPADQLCCGAAVASREAGAPPYCREHKRLRRGKLAAPVYVGRAL